MAAIRSYANPARLRLYAWMVIFRYGFQAREVYATDDGRVAIRFVRLLPHPPEKVWRAITDPEQLAAWFPAVVDLGQPTGASCSSA